MTLVIKNLPANAGRRKRPKFSILGSGRSPGGEHGNPFHYSDLGNPMDREAWRATVHGVTKSQTRLKRLSIAHVHSRHAVNCFLLKHFSYIKRKKKSISNCLHCLFARHYISLHAFSHLFTYSGFYLTCYYTVDPSGSWIHAVHASLARSSQDSHLEAFPHQLV